MFYSGGSQGGIFGGAIMAIAEDFERGFLAVPAANYSTLLHRSIDFNPFFAILTATYPDKLDQQLCFPLMQQLWDRAEPQGYLPHILPGDLSDPPRPHKILIHMATYDSEVSNVATEIMVRSLGIPQVVAGAAELLRHPRDGGAVRRLGVRRGGSAARRSAAATRRAPTDRGRGVHDRRASARAPGDPAVAHAVRVRHAAARRTLRRCSTTARTARPATRDPGMQIAEFLRDGRHRRQLLRGALRPGVSPRRAVESRPDVDRLERQPAWPRVARGAPRAGARGSASLFLQNSGAGAAVAVG